MKEIKNKQKRRPIGRVIPLHKYRKGHRNVFFRKPDNQNGLAKEIYNDKFLLNAY